MRSAHEGLRSGGGSSGFGKPEPLLARSASFFSSTRSARRLPQPMIRGETRISKIATFQKNPSDATNKRNSELHNPANIGSRKHAVFTTHCRSARPLQQRAGSKYFSDSVYK